MKLIAAIGAALLALGADPDLERRLQAAMHTEMIQGNLRQAVEQYRGIVASGGVSPAVAARALFRMAQCEEKLGLRREARSSYARLAAAYPGESELAAGARAKLAAWTDAAPGPRNLAFEEGASGQTPPGWFAPAVPARAEVRRSGCRTDAGCAAVSGSLMQSFSAVAYRGRTVRLRAWLRTQGVGAAGRLWLRVNRPGRKESFFDDMRDRPVKSTRWSLAEIACEVDADAQFIDFGVTGEGAVWIDDVSLEVVPKAEIDAARQRVQQMYSRVDFSIESTSSDEAAAIAMDGAGYREYGETKPLRAVLSQLAAAGGLGTQTTVSNFRLAGAGAVATARVEFSALEHGAAGAILFRDSWSFVGGAWTLAQRVFLTRKFTSPRTAPAAARLIVSDLKRLAAPLGTPEAGHTVYDLAPLDQAVKNARVVMLGESSGGVREFVQIRHRVLEFLARQRGFTTLLVEGDAETGRAIDRYIKTGEGDARALLSRLHAWRWSAQEALDVVEWLRIFNQGSDKLSFAAAASSTELETYVRGSQGKAVVWWNNADLTRVRKTLGSDVYVMTLAFHRAEARMPGYSAGESTGLGVQTVGVPQEGTGEWVFSTAGMPLFFLDLRSVPPMTTLGLWLAEPHLYFEAKDSWNRDDPQSHFRPQVLSGVYDGLIFVEQGRAAKGI